MKKKGITVLSLFDGISCARVALERAGIPVKAYYASEIDMHAMLVSRKNWPDIIQLGDITRLWGSLFPKESVDLLIGGSPCQDLSRAKHDGKGLEGERSGLFYEYLRILKTVKPRFFILENVASMKREYRDIITKELGVEPIMIDAALVSAQTRKRYFWTNIPGITLPEDRGILLKDIAEDSQAVMLTERRTEEAKRIRAKHKARTGKDFTPRRARELVSRKDGKANTLTRSQSQESWLLIPEKPTRPVLVGKLKGTNGGQGSRIYSANGKSITLPSHTGGNKTGLYETLPDGRLLVREATKKEYAIAEEGDSVDTSFPNSTTRRGRVGKKAKTLMTSTHIGIYQRGEVRPLTPVECERLQSLPDGYTEGIPKSHRIAVCGNAFNVEVVVHILRDMKL